MTLPRPTASRAVLVGVSEFKYLKKIPAALNNVDELSSVLQDGEMWALPRDRISNLKDASSSELILNVLHQAADDAQDTLLLYIASHGLLDSVSGELHIGLTGSEDEKVYFTAVPFSHIRRCFLNARALRKILILDCCYSGRAAEGMGPTHTLVADADIEGTCVFVASPATSRAIARRGARFTAFTGELIEILRYGIDGGPLSLTLDVVYNEVRNRLGAKGLPIPQQRNLNTVVGLSFGVNRKWGKEASLLVGTPEGKLLELSGDAGATGAVRVAAAVSLAEMRPARGIKALIHLSQEATNVTDAVRLNAAIALLSLDRTKGRHSLNQLRASSPSNKIRQLAAKALNDDVRDGDLVVGRDGSPVVSGSMQVHHWPSGQVPLCEL